MLSHPNWCNTFCSGSLTKLWALTFTISQQSPGQTQCPLLTRLICSPLGLPASASLASYDHSSHPGTCHIICLQPLFLLLTEQFLLACFASEGARVLCSHSALLCIAAVPAYLLISWIQVAPSMVHKGISACGFQPPSKPGREFWWAPASSTWMLLSNFDRAVPYTGIPLADQVSLHSCLTI